MSLTGPPAPVRTLILKHETGVVRDHTLLIRARTTDAELEAMSWIAQELGPDVPLHFSAFHPDWKMTDVPATPAATLTRARRIALGHGLYYVYTGNVHDTEGGTTFCPHCANALIVRDWYNILNYRVGDDGRCLECGGAIAGRYQHFDQAFGSRRIPVRLAALLPDTVTTSGGGVHDRICTQSSRVLLPVRGGSRPADGQGRGRRRDRG